ncbi:MAG: RNA methyltransferase [Bacteroidales bacterium]|nr:RNA methyltransferase [Bacteroidales bacterium]
MLSKNHIKSIKALHKSKHRRNERQFIVEGVKIVDEFINSDYRIINIYGLNDWVCTNENIDIEIIEVSQKELQSISLLKTPNKVLAIVAYPEVKSIDFVSDDLVLALDTIQDPGNLGTIIRIADWYGINKIICSNETADAYNPKVVQATMGAITRVKFEYTNLQNWLGNLPQNVNIYGTLLDGENMYESKLSDSGVIVVGNEGNGISEEVQALLTHKIKIPSYNNSQMESLNVAVATSIVCAEFRRPSK